MSWTDIPVLSCVPYDGDTLNCDLDLGFDITLSTSVRLLNVNTPEIDGAEKYAGLAVLNAVRGWIAGRMLVVDSIGWDKFGGRVDGVVRDRNATVGASLAAYLLDNGLAKPFDGKTKKPRFTAAECAAIIQKCKELSP